jgi:hypothetical protein
MNSPALQFAVECGDLRAVDPGAMVEVLNFGAIYIMPAAAEWDDACLTRVGPMNWDSAFDEQGFRRNPLHLYPCPECGAAGEYTADDLRVRCADRICPMRGPELPRAVWQHLGRSIQKADGWIRQLRKSVKNRREA